MPPTTRSKKSKGNQLHRSGPLVVNISTDKMITKQTTNQPVAIRRFPLEIPDSQEDPANPILSDNDGADKLGGYDTEIDRVPAETEKAILSWLGKNTPKEKPRYTLRARGLNCNGRLAAEHPDNKDMEDNPTQPSTQPRNDSRRQGSNSISEDDAADVICILHPCSRAAHQAVELVAKQCPQHILQNEGLDHLLDYDSDDQGPSEAERTRPDAGSQESQVIDSDTQDLTTEATVYPVTSTKDIALRLSSRVHNQSLGFTFGRNPQKCDIPIAAIDELKISNAHFRIYINTCGVLMCEDTSTNGTWVDQFPLMASSDDPNIDCRRTLNPSSMIAVIPRGAQDAIRFIVAIPQRDRQEAKYVERLTKYRGTIAQLERQAALAAQAAATGNVMAPPPLFALGNHQARTFAAGTMPFNHGMGWNGGNKYNVVAHIGKGAFANVYKLSTKANGDLIAAKEIEKRKYLKDGILDRKVHNEIEIMQKVNHQNIVQYLGYQETRTHLYVLMEFVPCGDLTPHVCHNNLLLEEQCQSVAAQTMQALDYLHRNNITHRDIKPDNILIASSEPMVVKLSDFGLSKVVTNDDTFLKTFCGTLLYCAPEIYPGYENVKKGIPLGKRGRNTPQLQTLPYQQSVDTWAFGAVMYHLLCGSPPYMGSHENKGQSMLQSVMSKPVNWDNLKQAGISAEGCDFVKRMLVLEPSARASDSQCLRHPWLSCFRTDDGADIEMDARLPVLAAIAEDGNEGHELDASQLSLHDGPAQTEINDDLEYDEGDGIEVRESKRLKADVPRAMGFEPRKDSVVSQGSEFDGYSMYSTMPMFINAGSRPVGTGAPTAASNRLYGEIGTSALGSSGVLGEQTQAALEMFAEGSRDESVVMSDDTSIDNTDSHVTNDGISDYSIQYPQLLPATTYAGSAQSLMGTEALVAQLNMASPESAFSAPSVDSKPATPRTPRSREVSPVIAAVAGSKRSSQETGATTQHEVIKRSKTDGTPDPSQAGSGRSHRSSAAHNVSKYSSMDLPDAPNEPQIPQPINAEASRHGNEKAHKSHRSSRSVSSKPTSGSTDAIKDAGGSHRSHHSRRSHRSSSRTEQKDFATKQHAPDDAVSSRAKAEGDSRSKHASAEDTGSITVAAGSEDKGAKGSTPKDTEMKDRETSSKTADTEGSKGKSKESKAPEDSQNGSISSSNTSSIPAIHQASPPNFLPPPPIFGKLTALPNSIITATIKLTSRLTMYGRELDNTVKFPNNLDNRVPRHAFDIIFWRPSLERDMAKGADWTKDEKIMAIISTRTSRWILVNGTKVTKGADCWQYGKLYTGDIITVFDDPAEGHQGTDFFKLECSFNVGVSRNKRPENERFVVMQERDNYQKTMGKKSKKEAKANRRAERAEETSSTTATWGSDETATPTPVVEAASAPKAAVDPAQAAK